MRLIRKDLIIYGLIAVCCMIEVCLRLSSVETIGFSRLRQLAYEYGGFWPGLLDNWRPNFASQPYAMFFTYSLLHVGLGHLTANMITLWYLGRPVIDRAGQRGFLLLYTGSCVGGGIGFVLLGPDLPPMVGASGALHGLFGALLAWAYVDRFTFKERLWPISGACLILIGLNMMLWWAMDRQVAWHAHLGGFVAGWILALLIDPRPLGEE